MVENAISVRAQASAQTAQGQRETQGEIEDDPHVTENDARSNETSGWEAASSMPAAKFFEISNSWSSGIKAEC